MNEVNVPGAVANVASGAVLYEILDYFNIGGEALIILTALLVLDFIMGITDAYIKNKKTVTSTKMWKGLAKKMTRWLLPFIVVGIFKGAGIEDMTITVSVILSILIISEGYSIIGHIYSINTGKKLAEIDAFELLLNLILSILKGKMPLKEETDKE